MADQASTENLKRTPLYALNVELDGKIVPFAGYEMPVQFPTGILKEHLHTRASAGLFDVSHMGQAILHLEGKGGHDVIAAAFETLVPGELKTLKPGQIRYTLLLNDQGGIRDDLMATRPFAPEEAGTLFLVVNAGTKDADFAHIASALKGRVRVERLEDRALLALQGPKAPEVLERIVPGVATMGFMTMRKFQWERQTLFISRSGYTGEDGYEISVPERLATDFARTLLADPLVAPIGLGARDSLRLEAGLCLYGHDIDEGSTPVEGNLSWSISKRRKAEGGFPGAARVQDQIASGPSRLRVGLTFDGRLPAREGAVIVDAKGATVGKVTSGGFGPSVNAPVAMGYVAASHAKDGTDLGVIVRGQTLKA
ncbi:MAG: glycine cleavage system aminomethyltransferase GcvT, partial [Burkholderiales bacterium]